MQPNQAPPPIDPSNMPKNDQYDFITNPATAKPAKKFSLPTGGSKTQRIILVVGAVIVLIMLMAIGASFMGKGDEAKKEQLIGVVSQQKELIRISEAGLKKAKSTEAKNLAITTQLTLTSEQAELYAALKKLGVKTDSKTIGGSKKAKENDAKLLAGEQKNEYDEVLVQLLKDELLKYAKEVQTAYKQNSSKSTKAALEAQFKNAATLAGFKEE